MTLTSTIVPPLLTSVEVSPARRGQGVPLERPALPDVLRFEPERRTERERGLADGSLRRVRAGVYSPPLAAAGVARRREEQVLLGVRAALEKLSSELWFSHDTAALLWGLWSWRLSGRVHMTQMGRPHVERGRPGGEARHRSALPDEERTAWVDAGSGLLVPVTSLERTVVDCARSCPSDAGLVVADAGLRLGADRERIEMILADAAGGRGVRRARWVLASADPRSESPTESVTRWVVLDAGLPAPEPAVEQVTWSGRRWVDLGWPELKVGIEVDGLEKYSGRYGDPQQILVDEKRRHDALVEAGWLLLRVTVEDLRHPDRLLARIVRALRSRGWTGTPSRRGSAIRAR
jgi:very-short-patch-repair endonuclease